MPRPRVPTQNNQPQSSGRPRVNAQNLPEISNPYPNQPTLNQYSRPSVPTPQPQTYQAPSPQYAQNQMNQFRAQNGMTQPNNQPQWNNQQPSTQLTQPQYTHYHAEIPYHNAGIQQPINPVGTPQPPSYIEPDATTLDDLMKMPIDQLYFWKIEHEKEHPLFWKCNDLIQLRKDQYWHKRHEIEDRHFEKEMLSRQDLIRALNGHPAKTTIVSQPYDVDQLKQENQELMNNES